MDDLIFRSAAINALMEQPDLTPSVIRRVMRQVHAADAVSREEYETMKADRDSWKDAWQEFNETAVKVVRCKECRFCKKHPTSDMVKLCTNEEWNTEYYPLVHDNDFCSYGERREDNAAD